MRRSKDSFDILLKGFDDAASNAFKGDDGGLSDEAFCPESFVLGADLALAFVMGADLALANFLAIFATENCLFTFWEGM